MARLTIHGTYDVDEDVNMVEVVRELVDECVIKNAIEEYMGSALDVLTLTVQCSDA